MVTIRRKYGEPLILGDHEALVRDAIITWEGTKSEASKERVIGLMVIEDTGGWKENLKNLESKTQERTIKPTSHQIKSVYVEAE